MRTFSLTWPDPSTERSANARRKYLREQRYLKKTAKLNALPLWY
jgi:hypothetical protein